MRSILLCAALVCAAEPLASQTRNAPSGATWEEVMSHARPAELQEHVTRGMQNTCARAFPDSVVLATPIAPDARAGSVWMHTGSASGMSGWEIATPPTSPDTLHARVLGVTCSRTSDSHPWNLTLVLRHGDHYLTYSPSSYGCTGGHDCDRFPLVRAIDADSVATLMWDDAGQRVIGMGAFDAEREARIRGYGWNAEMTRAVLERRVRVGMTSTMLREAWGDPRRINRTETSSGTHEQWVYHTAYIYVENGRVTSIQDSR